MISPAVLLAAAITTTRPVSAPAQQLMLSAEVGKTEFFEGEPIYLLVRLQNLSGDTGWVTFFGLGTLPVTLTLSRGNGNPLVRTLSHDYVVRPPWRGDPIAPGTSIVNTLVLQDLVGDEWAYRSHLFLGHLSADQYELHVEFDAHSGVPGTSPLTLKAAPISFRIRARTAAEEAEVAELERIRQMGWDTTGVRGSRPGADYQAPLINWVERRFGEQPDDPFLPFLLDNGVYSVGPIIASQVEAGKLPRFDPDTSEVVSRLRHAVIERQKFSTGGTRLVQALSARHPDQLAALANSLGSTPAGDMARYQVARSQHLQRSKGPPPR